MSNSMRIYVNGIKKAWTGITIDYGAVLSLAELPAGATVTYVGTQGSGTLSPGYTAVVVEDGMRFRATTMPGIADELREEARNWFRTSSHPDEDVDDLASTSSATVVRWRAAARIEELEAALRELIAWREGEDTAPGVWLRACGLLQKPENE
jgi:hypothetical protein